MKKWLIPEATVSSNKWGRTISLEDNQNVLIKTGVLIENIASNGYAITGGSGTTTSIINGTLKAPLGAWLGGWETDHEHIRIGGTGAIRGEDMALQIMGGDHILQNDGVIVSDGVGVTMYAYAHRPKDFSSIINGGTIRASNTIDIFLGEQRVYLENNGRILASKTAFDGQDEVDQILNTGLIRGNIKLGNGNNVYDGRMGHVHGTVTGGWDSDQILGGTEKNAFDGGDGSDVLYGGQGSDALAGGESPDVFVFLALADSTVKKSGRDYLIDFSQEDGDLIDLHKIDAKSAAAGNQRFTFIGNEGFSHTAGELHYRMSGGDTIIDADVDGDGKSDFSIAINGSIDLVKQEFIL